jgi:hypothetical protein
MGIAMLTMRGRGEEGKSLVDSVMPDEEVKYIVSASGELIE